MISINFLLVVLMGVFIGGVAGYLGSLMLTKHMTLMGGAFGHLALPGIALALVYGFDISLGALIFLVFGMLIVWFLERKSIIPVEALSAIVFTGSLSVAWLFLPENDRIPALIGDVSHISFLAILISIFVSIFVFILLRLIYSKIMLMSISEDIAISQGINVKKYNLIFLLCIVVVTALGVRILGGLMTVALIAIPSASGRNVSKSIKTYSYTSILFGALATGGGILLYPFIGIPAGPLVVIFSILIFVISIFFIRTRK